MGKKPLSKQVINIFFIEISSRLWDRPWHWIWRRKCCAKAWRWLLHTYLFYSV